MLKLSLDPMLNWDKLDRSIVINAQSMMLPVDKDEDFDDLIEWKLYQLHKPVHTRSMKKVDWYRHVMASQ